jgi:flagellin
VGIRINQNIMAMNSYRNLTTSESQLSKSLEKLSSGYRINKAADDASGLVISEGLRSQVMGLKMAIRNTQDGVSVVQTAEGALTEVHSLLQRIRELAVQAASTGSSDPSARDAAQAEVSQLLQEIDRISTTTKFGGQNLLNGEYGVTNGEAINYTTAPNGDTTGVAGADIVAGANDESTIEINGSGNVVTVTLTDFDYTTESAANAAALETDINNQMVSALAAAGEDYTAVVAKVELDTAGTGYNISFTAANGDDVVLDDGANDVLADLGFTGPVTLDSEGSGGVFQVGTDATDTISFAIQSTAAADLGATGIAGIDISDDASGALALIDAAITEVSVLRGDLGALQNRFEHTIANLSVTVENLSASESRIRDTDMAAEMMSFTRAQILQQAGTAMLAQANSVPQSVLQLLQ